MDSDEHDAMELYEVLVETNKFTYYTHETEQYAASYNMLNMATEC